MYQSAHLTEDGPLPTILTIGEFEQRVLLAPGRTVLDNDRRILMLRDASDFQHFHTLGFDRDFLRFLSHAPFLFGLFDELINEEVPISALNLADTYAEYDQHLNVLEHLLTAYRERLDIHHCSDPITLPGHYRLNRLYLKRFDAVEIHFEGYLSRFEQRILQETAAVVPTYLSLTLDRFSTKLAQRFGHYDLCPGHRYYLDLTAQHVLEKHPLLPSCLRRYRSG